MRITCAVAVAAALMQAAGGSAAAIPPKSGCTPARTRSLVDQFVRAFNTGDASAINDTWASKVWFRWYSVTTDPGARTAEEAARRDTLLPYFAQRHAAHERLTLTTLKLNGVSGGGYRNFEFQLLRNADDLVGGSVSYQGKGASTCSTGRLIAWVMGSTK
jgi:hypothetical protein